MKNLTPITLLMSLLQLIYTPATAQINLVPNPSFEEVDSCPPNREIFVAKSWINPTTATPDNFNQCNSSPSSGGFDLKPSISSKPKMPITDSENWVEVSGVYKANGGEEFMTIGMLSNFDSVYWVVVDTNGLFKDCYYYFDDISVIDIGDTPFKISSAFTPNNDGINDNIFPLFLDNSFIVKEFRVYNMWGEVVHNDPHNPWDGTYKNEPQPQSVYTYYLYIDLPDPYNPNETITYQKVGCYDFCLHQTKQKTSLLLRKLHLVVHIYHTFGNLFQLTFQQTLFQWL
jgi:gliding motility-associated-like protein